MTRHENSSEQRAKVVAAAHAAASWARARRAQWTDEPLRLPRTTPEYSARPAAVHEAAPSGRRLGAVLSKARAAVISWPLALKTSRSLQQIPKGRVIGAAAVAAALVAGVRYAPPIWKSAITLTTSLHTSPKIGDAVAAPAPGAPAAPRKTTGGLNIASTPVGARVLIDGTVRGVTPLSLSDVSAGRHLVVLESPTGTVQRPVTVTADAVTEVNESIFAGFVAIYSPFELSITEGTRAFRPDDRNEIMLPAGQHDLRLTNRALGFEEVRRVDLTPGQRLAISVTPPASTVTVSANEIAEVWLDGARVGETPLTDRPVPLGTHEILVKRAAGGERRFTATVTVKPFALYVDFSK